MIRTRRPAWSASLAVFALLPGCTTTAMYNDVEGAPVVAPSPTPPAPPKVPPQFQYLYGSGEAAALSMQTWHALVGYVERDRTIQYRAPGTQIGVVLTPTATLARPAFERCGLKPKAVLFDVDETVLLNLGFEYDDAANPRPYDETRWQAWERTGGRQVAAVPGAVEALAAIRKLGVTVVFNSNRSAANAAETAAAISGAGLGPAVHGETLFLSGDDAMGSRKDGRRARIAARYCVIAMGGDQLGDFSDLFNAGLAPSARRATTLSPAIAALWGNGWFVLPNPVYGSALKGGLDDVFPTDKRWAPPAPPEK